MITPTPEPIMPTLPPLNCNGCRKCCLGDTIAILPEHGDDHRKYKTTFNKRLGKRVLRKGPTGNCVYLGPTGCKIYDKQPHMCRVYDCRLHFLKRMHGDNGGPLSEGRARLEAPQS